MSTAGVHSFGRDLRSCQLDGIHVSETELPAGLQLPEHAHEAGQICFVLEGEYRERAGHTSYAFHPGTLLFHTPGEQHSNVVSPESAVLTLLISIEPDRWLHFGHRRVLTLNSVLTACACEIQREMRKKDEAARVALEGWAMLCLSLVGRQAQGRPVAEPSWLREAVGIVEKQATAKLSLERLAAQVGVHRATLAAAFRHFRQMSVGESIRQQRIRRVMHALVSTKMPLCEIATAHGFSDQAHMGRVFRQAIGTTPGAYRAVRR
jgi:AraC-like DNA-binding protein